MEPMIKCNHPRIRDALTTLKYKRYYHNKDWIAALLHELRAIEYSSCSRLKNPNGRPRKSDIVSICIILGIDLEKSVELLESAGHRLRSGNKMDDAYSFLIIKSHQEAQSGNSGDRLSYYALIDEYNEILRALVGTVKTLDRLGPILK